jgi:hypothetical protein
LFGFPQDAEDLGFIVMLLHGPWVRFTPRTLTHSTPVSGEQVTAISILSLF